MDVLVDYYNIPLRERRKGIVYVTDRIVSAIPPGRLPYNRRIRIRLYGGWYEDRTLTHDAQELTAELSAYFPAVRYLEPTGRLPTTISAELACSLLCDPIRHLWHTLRPKGYPRYLQFIDPTAAGCKLGPRCPTRPGFEIYAGGRCREPQCDLSNKDLVRRREQKLVDAMLASDIFFNAHLAATRITVVSSDDDMWPAIRTALQLGIEVFHLHTDRGQSTKPHYVHRTESLYVPLNLIGELRQ